MKHFRKSGPSWILLAIGAISLLTSPPIQVKADDLKEDAKSAGRAVGSTAREVGQGVKQVGKEIGRGAREAVHAVGDAVKDGVEAAKEGGREFKRAVNGE